MPDDRGATSSYRSSKPWDTPLPRLGGDSSDDPDDRPWSFTDEEHWLLSFYRASEISGALFFGRIARTLNPGPLQADMSHHFADEAKHASYWTRCVEELGAQPMRLPHAYQDAYLEAAGLPANMMEVLSITHVFEKRVFNQYIRHLKTPDLHPAIAWTIGQILEDEKWHVHWVSRALKDMEATHGADEVRGTLARHAAADREVYAKTIEEHGERFGHILAAPPEEDVDEPG